jgi:hypothetical protein
MSIAAQNIATGAEVYTMDGEKLGTVKTVRPAHFKVDAPMQADYWLACDCVQEDGSRSAKRVTVAFSKDRLSNYKQEMSDDEA